MDVGMLTIFTIPKPFRGHTGIIQRNAIHSWTLLRPACEIILFGDDEGTAEVAKEFGVRYMPEVARNEYGTPLVNELFDQAQHLATHDLLCYVNADIILMSDFMPAIERIKRRKKRFLMVGQRWDLDMQESLVFDPDWEKRLRTKVRKYGQLHPITGMDYFVFPRGLWGEIPPFAIGRTAWDNWLVYRARNRKAAVVDATPVVTAVHQNHDWSHIAGGRLAAWTGVEAQRNRTLMENNLFTLRHANWLLTKRWLRPALRVEGLVLGHLSSEDRRNIEKGIMRYRQKRAERIGLQARIELFLLFVRYPFQMAPWLAQRLWAKLF